MKCEEGDFMVYRRATTSGHIEDGSVYDWEANLHIFYDGKQICVLVLTIINTRYAILRILFRWNCCSLSLRHTLGTMLAIAGCSVAIGFDAPGRDVIHHVRAVKRVHS